MIFLECPRSLLGGFEVSEKLFLSRPVANVGNVPLDISAGSVDSSWKVPRFPVGSVTTISDVHGMGCDSQVFKPVVEGVSVDVIDHHSLREGNLVKGKNNPVNQKLSFLSSVKDSQRKIGYFLGQGLLGFARDFLTCPSGIKSGMLRAIREVRCGANFPVQFSGFSVVPKGFLKKFKRRQFSARLHSGDSVWSLGAFGSSELPDAPSLYTHQPD